MIAQVASCVQWNRVMAFGLVWRCCGACGEEDRAAKSMTVAEGEGVACVRGIFFVFVFFFSLLSLVPVELQYGIGVVPLSRATLSVRSWLFSMRIG